MKSQVRLLAIAVVATGLMSASGALFAANVPEGLVTGNARVCEKLAASARGKTLDPHLPADASKVNSYCSCTSKTYWTSVPQDEFDGMWAEHQAGTANGPHSLTIRAHLAERMEAARKSCQ